MARIRSIKPEFWADEKIATLSFPARLLAIALLNYADDEGFFNANEKLVKAFAFPLDDTMKIPVLLRELSGIGYVSIRSCQNGSKNGQSLGLVSNFLRHQYINKPKCSNLRSVWESSGTSTVAGTEASAQEGNGMEGSGGGRGDRFAPPPLEDVVEYGKEIPGLNAEAFFDYYASKGWRVGTSPMRDWRAAARKWRRKDIEDGKIKAPVRDKRHENYLKQMAEQNEGKNETP